MIDTEGNIRPGKPRRGKEQVEYQRVKADIIDLLNLEVPDREIAARLGLSKSGFYQLKKRILKEIIPSDIALNVAAREYMRLDRQLGKLIRYMDNCWAAEIPPDAPYITAFTNLSRRVADLVGANAAIAITVDHGDDDDASQTLREHQLAMAAQLNRFYELQDRMATRVGGPGAIGSGLTKEERDRELANLQAALPPGRASDELAKALADGLADDFDDDSPDIEDAVELIEDDGFDDHDWDVGDEIVAIPRDSGRSTTTHRRYERECAAGAGDPEVPGRWVAGRFVSWWHDLGDSTPEPPDFEIGPTSDLDGPPPDELYEC